MTRMTYSPADQIGDKAGPASQLHQEAKSSGIKAGAQSEALAQARAHAQDWA